MIYLYLAIPKLTDFGLSCVTASQGATTSVVGTPLYMAPEGIANGLSITYLNLSSIWVQVRLQVRCVQLCNDIVGTYHKQTSICGSIRV